MKNETIMCILFIFVAVTYAQGMNDVLSRFLVVMENETEAYWCFTLYLEKVVDDFLETGMIKKLGRKIRNIQSTLLILTFLEDEHRFC